MTFPGSRGLTTVNNPSDGVTSRLYGKTGLLVIKVCTRVIERYEFNSVTKIKYEWIAYARETREYFQVAAIAAKLPVLIAS